MTIYVTIARVCVRALSRACAYTCANIVKLKTAPTMDYQIFQNLAFPIALAVVLLYAVRSLYRSYIDYLIKQNERLTNIISECTKALNNNTEVFERLINDFLTKT